MLNIITWQTIMVEYVSEWIEEYNALNYLVLSEHSLYIFTLSLRDISSRLGTTLLCV